MSHKKTIFILFIIVALFIFFWLFKIFLLTNNNNPARVIVPPFISDDYFYYARLKEIKDGYPFLGNPFYFEHRTDVNSSFFIPDLLAALPYLFNSSLFYSFSFNLFVWSLIIALVLYYLFYIMKFPPKICLAGSFFVFLSTTGLFFRPTILQTVYPFFILGLIIFYYWLQKKINNKLFFITTLFLAFSLYLYQHLAIFLYSFAGVLAAYFLSIREIKKFSKISGSILLSLFIASPILIHYYLLSKNAVFKQLLLRIDNAFTHLPGFFVFMTGKWIAVVIIIWFLILKLSKKTKGKRNIGLFFIFLGVSSVLAASSNIITGVRVEIAEHIYRFQKIYISITTFLSLVYILKYKSQYLQVSKKVFYCLSLFWLILLIAYLPILSQSICAIKVNPIKIKSFQDYRNIVFELNKLPDESVILANEEISSIIPVYTRHYVLFARDANSYLVSNDEIQERYLLSHVFDDEYPDFKSDIGLIIGYGKEYDFYKEHNRWINFCNKYNFIFSNIKCGQQKTNLDKVGLNFIPVIKIKYNYIKDNYIKYLNKYNLNYLLIDKRNDKIWKKFKPPTKYFKKIYNDGRFELYSFVN